MKILVIQTAFLGDLIMSTPIFKGIKRIYPSSQVDLITTPQNRGVIENNPHIDNILTFNKSSSFNKGKDFIKLLLHLRKERYQIALSIQGSFTSSLLLLLGGVKRRIGSRRQKLLTDPITFVKGSHIRERIGLMLESVKQDNFDLNTETFPKESDKKVVDSLFSIDDRFTIGVAPGSVRVTKRWPKENFVKLIDKIKDRYRVILIGGPTDREITDYIAEKCDIRDDFTGKLSLLQSVEMIRRLDLFISNDSAPLHMANSVDTPVFAFFGPTVKSFGCYPYRKNDQILEVDLPCRPCGKHGGKICPEEHFRCMKDIKPEDVAIKVDIFIEGLKK
jgi:heptosyltransferase-2